MEESTMEQTLEIIEGVIDFVAIALVATCIWPWKSKDRLSFKAFQIGLATIVLTLQIPRLIIQMSLEKSYGMTIFILCIGGLCIILDAFLIGIKIGKKSIEDINDVNERNEESSKKEDDNN